MDVSVPWIEPESSRPLCDVPWYGIAPVNSRGEVNFCCYSNAIVGNIREKKFDEIWNGEEMQSIRKSLSNQVLPEQCKKSSCPIYRKDPRSHLLVRMDGKLPSERKSPFRFQEKMSQSALKKSKRNGSVVLDVSLKSVEGTPSADVFVCVSSPEGGDLKFMPQSQNFPVPLARLEAGAREVDFKVDLGNARGRVFVALFESGSDPNIALNGLFAASLEI